MTDLTHCSGVSIADLEQVNPGWEPSRMIHSPQFHFFKDAHKENTSSNKTQALTKSVNMGISEIGASNQLLIRGSYTEIKFFKK